MVLNTPPNQSSERQGVCNDFRDRIKTTESDRKLEQISVESIRIKATDDRDNAID